MTDPVALVAHAVFRHRDDFIRRLVDTTEAEIAALEHDETLRGLLDASITENVVTSLHILTHAMDPHTVDAPASALTYARRLAQRDVSLSALLRAYRLTVRCWTVALGRDGGAGRSGAGEGSGHGRYRLSRGGRRRWMPNAIQMSER
ncbi:hypothetical protein ABZV31_20190 [Streptomyces sp. NPDC005202]|uniref:hypothetical protein n=1 Tax=Streptomyces sp. NPDC005202 TaxID=3157021 RepID=UPI0033A117E0